MISAYLASQYQVPSLPMAGYLPKEVYRSSTIQPSYLQAGLKSDTHHITIFRTLHRGARSRTTGQLDPLSPLEKPLNHLQVQLGSLWG